MKGTVTEEIIAEGPLVQKSVNKKTAVEGTVNIKLAGLTGV